MPKSLIVTIARPGAFPPDVMDKIAHDLKTKGTTTNPLNGKECRVIEAIHDRRGITVTLEVGSDMYAAIANPPPGPLSIGMGCRTDPTPD